MKTSTSWLLIISILILIAQPAVFAECQYKANVTNFGEVQKLYEKGTDRFITDSLEIRNITVADRSGSFEVYNKFDVPITIRLTFDYGYSVFSGPRQRITYDSDLAIPKKSFQKIQIGPNETIWARFEFYNDTMKYAFQDNNETYQKYETVSIAHEECKACLGKDCLDDGAFCSANAECGGGYCVEQRCNNGPVCYNSDCGCSEDEIQCPDNDMCIPRNVLDAGAVPICSALECKTNYTNITSGECAIRPVAPISPEDREKARLEVEKTKNDVLLILALIVVVASILFYMKLEFDRRKLESDLEKREKKRANQ